MIIEALKMHGELTTEELAEIVGKPIKLVEQELSELRVHCKICTRNGVHYLPPKLTFSTVLLTAFLMFIGFWYGVAAF